MTVSYDHRGADRQHTCRSVWHQTRPSSLHGSTPTQQSDFEPERGKNIAPGLRLPIGFPERIPGKLTHQSVCHKLLIVLVGAAGFEPATCSTQNCRATRLRYTPWHTWRLLDTCFAGCQQGGRLPPLSTSKSTAPRHYFLNIAPATLSPGAIPSLRAVPPITSSTARTGPPDGTRRSESGSVFSAMRRMLPSALIKIMSSGM